MENISVRIHRNRMPPSDTNPDICHVDCLPPIIMIPRKWAPPMVVTLQIDSFSTSHDYERKSSLIFFDSSMLSHRVFQCWAMTMPPWCHSIIPTSVPIIQICLEIWQSPPNKILPMFGKGKQNRNQSDANTLNFASIWSYYDQGVQLLLSQGAITLETGDGLLWH